MGQAGEVWKDLVGIGEVDVELIPLLSTIILVATIVTIVFAFVSYLAYRSREKKAPKARGPVEFEPQFVKRYIPTE